MAVAVCLIVKNECTAIPEWIAHYALLGFDTIFVIDDFSTDGSDLAIKSMAKQFDVRYLLQPFPIRTRQVECFTHICQTYKEFDWIAFFDIDEFLISPTGQSLHTLLETEAVAITVPWLVFGSSGHIDPPALILENYLHRAEDSFKIGYYNFKSIVRPQVVIRAANAHLFSVRGKYVDTDGNFLINGMPVDVRRTPSFEHWRLHHYYTRSKADWAVRMARGQIGNRPNIVQLEHFDQYDRNEVYDPAALQYVEAIKCALLNSGSLGLHDAPIRS